MAFNLRTLSNQQIEAREYIGINLKAGNNRIVLKQFDALGNVRGAPDDARGGHLAAGQPDRRPVHVPALRRAAVVDRVVRDRKSTRLNSSH